jgi:hypothetical protein
MHSSCQRECHGKADGKKEVMGKERKSKEGRLVEKKRRLIDISNPASVPLTKKFLVRKI